MYVYEIFPKYTWNIYVFMGNSKENLGNERNWKTKRWFIICYYIVTNIELHTISVFFFPIGMNIQRVQVAFLVLNI